MKLAGQLLDDAGAPIGAMAVIEAADLATARAFNATDPYTLKGVFSQVQIHPWRLAMGAIR